MNLLTDAWIPVTQEGQIKQITLRELLCMEADWQPCSHRDDMEMAALQLVICLTQVIFMPDDPAALKRRMNTPLTEAEYDKGISNFDRMFILDHPTHPFMQTRGVKAKEVTPMQKLFIGLPEGNNHAFFNKTAEIDRICPSCTAIALFNQASNCPSFGGGFKGGLRGAAPLVSLVLGETLRNTIWRNILHLRWIQRILPAAKKQNTQPVWAAAVKTQECVYAHRIGLLRGLLWQPAHVEILWSNAAGRCAACGFAAPSLATGFLKEKFKYELKGSWHHPHSPRDLKKKKGKLKQQYSSFTSTAPAWTQLNDLLISRKANREGHIPAPVISQFKEICPFQNLTLLVGGYRARQASVLERRHEMFSLAAGWVENVDKLDRFVILAIETKEILRKKVYGFGKTVGMSGLSSTAEKLFYQNSETMVHQCLRSLKWSETQSEFQNLHNQLGKLALGVLEEVTLPYRHEVKMIRALVVARRTLASALSKLAV
jgi:CRISPR system Cascade subunit CasA